MTRGSVQSRFETCLLRPRDSGGEVWAFIILPAEVSATLPRRGRTTISGSVNGHAFEALLEPDGNKSHWLKLDEALLRSAGVQAGQEVSMVIEPVAQEPEPRVPEDLAAALSLSSEARSTWEQTTTLARHDWVHWIDSAKTIETRTKRVHDACEMLASGKKRVCCFDASGYYSKAFSAPQVLT